MLLITIILSTSNSPGPRTFSGSSKSISLPEYFNRMFMSSPTRICLTWSLRAITEHINTGHCESTTLPMTCSDALMSSTSEHDQTWWCYLQKETMTTPISMVDWLISSRYQYTTKGPDQWQVQEDKSCVSSGFDGMRGTPISMRMGFWPYVSLDYPLWMEQVPKLMGSLIQLLSSEPPT